MGKAMLAVELLRTRLTVARAMAKQALFATRWGIVIISPERAGEIPDEAFQESISASLQEQ
jgi:hypothetical protein